MAREALLGKENNCTQRIGARTFLVDEVPNSKAAFFEGFSTFACKPLLNIHDIVVAKEDRGCGSSRYEPDHINLQANDPPNEHINHWLNRSKFDRIVPYL
jgi:hypothetical protein